MKIFSVGSSSSGNSYIIEAAGRAIILDAGLPCKTIMAGLDSQGIEPGDVAAVLITHEHSDHVKSVRALSRKCSNAIFYASRGTIKSAPCFEYVPEDCLISISAGESFAVVNQDEYIGIKAFELSHDASEPIGFTIEAEGEKLAVVTDTGIVSDEIYEAIYDADMLVFEANHDVDMLMFGEYPYPVKVRIKGDQGHLSNDYAADVLVRILKERTDKSEATKAGQTGVSADPLRILLAHLSFHNNAPLFARQTVEDRLSGEGFKVGEDYLLGVAMKEGLTYMP